MNKFFQSVASTILAAALVANVALLWSFNERLTRIETQLAMQHKTATAQNQ